MNRSYKIMATLLIGLITFLIVAEALQPDPINWFESYNKIDKIPFGSYIFYEELDKNQDLETENVKVPPFEFLLDSTVSGTYFFVNNSVYFDSAEANKILNWVEQGNTLFISATAISKTILDSLNLETTYYKASKQITKRPLLNLSNPKLKSETPYSIKKDINTVYFDKIDTVNTTVLGTYDLIRNNDSTHIAEPKVNFIKVPYKKGSVVLHTFPQAFTNYFMLGEKNSDYTGKILSYVPKNAKIYLDQYYKSGKSFNSSPLYMVLNNKYLRWAYYTIIIIALLYVYFEGKRKQRSIPVVKPLANQTLTFTRTIAGMYLEKGENKQIAQHQINHFMEFLRSHYSIATAEQGSEFIEKIAAKSQTPLAEVKELIDYIILIQQKAHISQNELIALNKKIERFKAHV
tara:strand:- start:85719 stop:86930 length:1212 start_codon:yes stop_codon:yes gene_type:complete